MNLPAQKERKLTSRCRRLRELARHVVFFFLLLALMLAGLLRCALGFLGQVMLKQNVVNVTRSIVFVILAVVCSPVAIHNELVQDLFIR